MSLDVWLTEKEPVAKSGTGVFVREGGQIVELTLEQIKEKFPEAEVSPQEYESNDVFEYNITHNLSSMADKAGIYYALWRPEERHYYKGKDLIVPLTRGLKKLKDTPGVFIAMNPDNGWGSYEGLVTFVELYLNACKEYPNAEIGVSR